MFIQFKKCIHIVLKTGYVFALFAALSHSTFARNLTALERAAILEKIQNINNAVIQAESTHVIPMVIDSLGEVNLSAGTAVQSAESLLLSTPPLLPYVADVPPSHLFLDSPTLPSLTMAIGLPLDDNLNTAAIQDLEALDAFGSLESQIREKVGQDVIEFEYEMGLAIYEAINKDVILHPSVLLQFLKHGAESNFMNREDHRNSLLIKIVQKMNALSKKPETGSLEGPYYQMLDTLFGGIKSLHFRKNMADPDLSNDLGETALFLATHDCNPMLIQYLLSKNANATIENKKGESAVSLVMDLDYIVSCDVTYLFDGIPAFLLEKPNYVSRLVDFRITPARSSHESIEVRRGNIVKVQGDPSLDAYYLGNPKYPPEKWTSEENNEFTQGKLIEYRRPVVLEIPIKTHEFVLDLPEAPPFVNQAHIYTKEQELKLAEFYSIYVDDRLSIALNPDEFPNRNKLLTFAGNGATSKAYFYHSKAPSIEELGYIFPKLKLEKGHRKWAKYSSKKVIKIRKPEINGEIGLPMAASLLKRDFLLNRLLERLASNVKYVNKDGSKQDLIRVAKYDENYSRMKFGILDQPTVNGVDAWNIFEIIQRVERRKDIRKLKYIQDHFGSIDEAKRKLRALLAFLHLTKQEVQKFLEANDLPLVVGTVHERDGVKEGPEKKSNHKIIEVGFDFNHGANVLWSYEDKIFVFID